MTKVAMTLLVALVVGGCDDENWVYNTAARQRAVCAPESYVIRTQPQGYKGSSTTLAVYCADGRWALLQEGSDQPEVVRGKK